MYLKGRSKFIAAVVGWTSGVLVALVGIEMFSLEYLFVLALVGYLAAIELLTPRTIVTQWSRRLGWFSVLGLIVLGGIVVRKALETLPEAYLP